MGLLRDALERLGPILAFIADSRMEHPHLRTLDRNRELRIVVECRRERIIVVAEIGDDSDFLRTLTSCLNHEEDAVGHQLAELEFVAHRLRTHGQMEVCEDHIELLAAEELHRFLIASRRGETVPGQALLSACDVLCGVVDDEDAQGIGQKLGRGFLHSRFRGLRLRELAAHIHDQLEDVRQREVRDDPDILGELGMFAVDLRRQVGVGFLLAEPLFDVADFTEEDQIRFFLGGDKSHRLADHLHDGFAVGLAGEGDVDADGTDGGRGAHEIWPFCVGWV